jgi:hypothetical protein
MQSPVLLEHSSLPLLQFLLTPRAECSASAQQLNLRRPYKAEGEVGSQHLCYLTIVSLRGGVQACMYDADSQIILWPVHCRRQGEALAAAAPVPRDHRQRGSFRAHHSGCAPRGPAPPLQSRPLQLSSSSSPRSDAHGRQCAHHVQVRGHEPLARPDGAL